MKTKNQLLFFFFLLGIVLYPYKEANAVGMRKLTMEGQAGIYYTRNGGTLTYASNLYSFYSLDGNVAYCVEPGVKISDYTYKEEMGLENLSYSKEVKELIQLIGYYGYEYPNHQTVRFRMATQALIWETVSGGTVEFYTKRYGYGNLIDIRPEREEILRLVASHDEKPSFHDLHVDGYMHEEIVLKDKNQVLSDFEVVEANTNSVFIVGDELHIIPKKMGKSDILLKKKQYDTETTLLFIAGDGKGQKIAKLRADKEVVSKISLNIVAGKLFIEKVDSETNSNLSQGVASLEGAIYGIYDEKDSLLTKVVTDQSGKAESEYLNHLGKYKLKEIKPSLGYELDPTVYEFEITKENLYPIVRVLEKVIKREVTIFKALEGADNTLLQGEENITFAVYLKEKNQLYQEITTDKLGYASINLPYGTYIFKQKNTTFGYEKVEDFEVIIDENSDSSIYKSLVDKQIKAKVKVIKVDKETGEPVLKEGILFKIKDRKTNTYVCQKDENLKEICVFKTNERGEFTTPDFLFGEYLLEEVENQTIDGYLWNPNPFPFSTLKEEYEKNERGENIVVIKFANERVKGKIEINKVGEELIIENGTYFYKEIPLPSVKFHLYANEDLYLNNTLQYKKGDLVQSLITDEFGKASIDNLLLGSYYLLEIESQMDHVVDSKKYFFELNHKDQYTGIVSKEFHLKNYLPKGKVSFLKKDALTNLPLENAIIEIYKKMDSKTNLVYKGKTNALGQILLEEFPIGSYFIVEVESPNGYQLSNEKISFTVSNQETIELDMLNQPIETIQVPNTSLEDSFIRKIISFLFLGIGIGCLLKVMKVKVKSMK